MPSVKMSKVRIMHEELCREYDVTIPLVFFRGMSPEGYTQFDKDGNPIKMGVSKISKRKAGTLMHEWAHIIEKKIQGQTWDWPHSRWHEEKKVELMRRFHIKGLYLRFPDLNYFNGFPPPFPYPGINQ